jgi:hypothetical protein
MLLIIVNKTVFTIMTPIMVYIILKEFCDGLLLSTGGGLVTWGITGSVAALNLSIFINVSM